MLAPGQALPRAQGGDGSGQIQVAGQGGEPLAQAREQAGLGLLGGRLDIDRNDAIGQSRQQPGLDQRRFAAAAGTVDHPHRELAVRAGLDAVLPEAQAFREAVLIARAGEQIQEEPGVVGVERSQALGNHRDPGFAFDRGRRGSRGRHWFFDFHGPFEDLCQLCQRLVDVRRCERLAPLGGSRLAELLDHPGDVGPGRKTPRLVQALDQALQGTGPGRLVEHLFVNLTDHQLQHLVGTPQRHFRVFVGDAAGFAETLEALDQPVNLARKILPGTDGGAMAIGQRLQVIGQIGRARHRGLASHEQGHHGDVRTSQGRRDLDPHPILRVIQPPRAFLRNRWHPASGRR